MLYTNLANDFRFCRDVTRRSASSFYYALRLLAPPRRKALYAVYAFCRAVDDAVDDSDPAESPRLVAEWRAELARCYQGTPLHPVTVALCASLERFPIPQSALSAIVDGVEMDLVKRRYASFAELEIYCRRVASAVGLASIEIFGYTSPATRDYAVDVGLALQLTNILRDIDEDAAVGRLYLPREALREAGIDTTDPQSAIASPALAKACARIVDIARGHFAEAERIMAASSRRAVRAPRIMGKVYRAILDRMVERGWAAPRERVRIGRLHLLGIVLRHAFI